MLERKIFKNKEDKYDYLKKEAIPLLEQGMTINKIVKEFKFYGYFIDNRTIKKLLGENND